MKAPKTVGIILRSERIVCCKQKRNTTATTIIGIDPGLQNLGIGIMRIDKMLISEPDMVGIRKKKPVFTSAKIANAILDYAYVSIKFKANRSIDQKLWFVFENIEKLLIEHIPELIIVEDAFVGINKNSALKLGLVRGAILSAVGKYNHNCEKVDDTTQIPTAATCVTISPKQIKNELTNNGAAQKEEIQDVFRKLLKEWPDEIVFDASDALAAAFCGIKLIATKKYV